MTHNHKYPADGPKQAGGRQQKAIAVTKGKAPLAPDGFSANSHPYSAGLGIADRSSRRTQRKKMTIQAKMKTINPPTFMMIPASS